MGLEGKTVLVTRSLSQSRELIALLEGLGAAVISIPTIAIGPPETWESADEAIRRIADFDWIIFTSANSVDAFLDRAGSLSGRSSGLKLAAVGSQTARRIEERELKPDFVPEDFRAEGLIKDFPEDLTGARILLPRAETGNDLLPDTLTDRGARVDVVAVYRNEMPTTGDDALRSVLAAGTVDCISLTSGSTAKNLIRMLSTSDTVITLEKPAIAVIGPVTRRAVLELGLHVDIEPEVATIPALVDAIQHYLETK